MKVPAFLRAYNGVRAALSAALCFLKPSGLIWCHERAQCTNYSHLCLRARGWRNCTKAKGDCVMLGGERGTCCFHSLPQHPSNKGVNVLPPPNCKCGFTVGCRRDGKAVSAFSLYAQSHLNHRLGDFFSPPFQ